MAQMFAHSSTLLPPVCIEQSFNLIKMQEKDLTCSFDDRFVQVELHSAELKLRESVHTS
jgi:hypothetical protein